jgi:flagellar protein FliJ
MEIRIFNSFLMSNMKSESTDAALESALRMKATAVTDLEGAIREFEDMASVLDRQIKAEEHRTRIKDVSHPAYSNFAKSATQRRDNLRASATSLKVKLEEALRERDDVLEKLNRASVPATDASNRFKRPGSASTRT